MGNELWRWMHIPETPRPQVTLTAVIITGSARYEKELHNGYMRSSIWKICTETMAQLESEQYITQKGFVKESLV